jgi:hypothetical protein
MQADAGTVTHCTKGRIENLITFPLDSESPTFGEGFGRIIPHRARTFPAYGHFHMNWMIFCEDGCCNAEHWSLDMIQVGLRRWCLMAKTLVFDGKVTPKWT